MDDRQLIDLVRRKTPQELSLEEIELLRERLTDSPQLCQELAEQIRLESYLTEALARIDVPVDQILARARRRRWLGRSQIFSLLGFVACLGLIGFIIFVFVVALVIPPGQQRIGPDAAAVPPDHENHPTDPPQPVAETPSDIEPSDVGPSAASDSSPWQAVMTITGELPRFEDICFDDFPTDNSLPRSDDLRQWFAPVDNAPYRITDIRSPRGECGMLNGVARLMSPWTEDSALRLSLGDFDRLKIHFFNGSNGVTLIYYEEDHNRWAAYATTRKNGAMQPETFALTATDAARSRRSEIRLGGPLEIRHRQGELILSRGDVVLLRAPLSQPPEQVFFDGRAVFYGIDLIRTSDFPLTAENLPTVATIEAPATLAWSEHLGAGGAFEKLADGSVQLTASGSTKAGWVSATLPQKALCEIVLKVEDATPGAGVFLADSSGQPRETLRFVHNRSGGGVCLAMHGGEPTYHDELGSLDQRVVSVTGKTQWIRLLHGCGFVRWWMSCDGVHWAEVTGPRASAMDGVTSVGLSHVASANDCHINLRLIEFRQLDDLIALADTQLLEKTAAPGNVRSLEEWLSAVTETQPQQAELAVWRRTCAVAALDQGCSSELALGLIELLLDEAPLSSDGAENQLKILNQAVLLLDTYNDSGLLAKVVALYRQLAMEAFESENLRPYSLVRKSLMTAPFALKNHLRVSDDTAIRAELVQLLSSGQWRETIEFCRRLRFFHQQQQSPLVEWAEATASREIPSVAGQSPAWRHRASWRHPLVEEYNKETYNVVAELQNILESDAFQDAARLIATTTPSAMQGVAPHSRDRQLLVSFPAAVRLATQEYPQLTELMNREWGEIAQLRIGQAIAQADVAALKLACVQFESTEVAAAAHRWLGDRALSSGLFTQALSHYRRGLRTAAATDLPQLQARVRLAAAMLGQNMGQKVTTDVRLGQSRMSAPQFESLVAEMLSRNAASLSVTPGAYSGARHIASAPLASVFRSQLRGPMEGALGEQRETELSNRIRSRDIDWVGRQLACVVEDGVLYVSNRFQVTALDLTNGSQIWQSPQPSAAMMRSLDWALTPMRPLISSQAIYARMLYGQGPILVCLDKRTGEIRWRAESRGGEFLVSDPLMAQGQLVAFTLARTEQRIGVLRLTRFDAETGRTLAQRDLLRLRDVWWSRSVCMATMADESIVASLGGLTLCCDMKGRVRWIRKQIALPTKEDPSWLNQVYEAPLLYGDNLLVAQPGVRSIECLDLDSGGRHWSAILPDLQRILGVANNRLIVQTAGGLRALDLTNGKTLWKHRANDMLEAQLCGAPGGVLYSRRAKTPDGFCPQLIWLDPTNGQRQATVNLPQLSDAQPRLGPLVLHERHLWTFFGRGNEAPHRQLVELIPDSATSMVPNIRFQANQIP